MRIQIPSKMIPVFAPPRGSVRFRDLSGGRGSGKSFTAAKIAATWGANERLRILCTRDIQDSIKESFHAELKAAIASEPWLSHVYDVGVDYLRCKRTGTEFLFRGLRHSIGAIKSTAGIDLCIIEEAEDVTESAWIDLEPTIRAPKSEIWTLWNPRIEGSPVDRRMRKNPQPGTVSATVNYCDNPWFPKVLDDLRRHQQRTMEPEMYRHIWLGEYLKHSSATVFRNRWRVEEFTPQHYWDGPYQGADFGFSQDPSCLVRLWIHDGRLFVEYDSGGVGLEIDELAKFWRQRIPDVEKYVTRADNARPDTISYLNRHGMPRVESCEKGKGSVEDGIAHMKSYSEIVVHPRCEDTQEELSKYSYKVDRHSGDVLPILVDAWNHRIDAIRYALEPVMRNAMIDYGALL